MSLDCGLWEEAEYSDETRAHKENMQNEHRKGPSWASNHKPSWCEVTALTTVSLSHMRYKKKNVCYVVSKIAIIFNLTRNRGQVSWLE